MCSPARMPSEPPVARTDDVWVHRVPGLSFSRDSHIRRALAYLSLYPRLLSRALLLPPPDVIVTKTDPPMLKVLGPVLGQLTGAATIHWAQDLYPEVAEALDVIPAKGWLANAMRSLSTWALQGHDHIVAVGRCMKRRIEARGIAPEKISVIPNWAPDTVHPVPHDQNAFRQAQGWEDKTVVMYSGNMGLAHPFEVILDAAEQLRDERPDMVFAFVGRGPAQGLDCRAGGHPRVVECPAAAVSAQGPPGRKPERRRRPPRHHATGGGGVGGAQQGVRRTRRGSAVCVLGTGRQRSRPTHPRTKRWHRAPQPHAIRSCPSVDAGSKKASDPPKHR